MIRTRRKSGIILGNKSEIAVAFFFILYMQAGFKEEQTGLRILLVTKHL